MQESYAKSTTTVSPADPRKAISRPCGAASVGHPESLHSPRRESHSPISRIRVSSYPKSSVVDIIFLTLLSFHIVALERRLSLDPTNLDALSLHGDADLSQQHPLPVGSTPPPGPASDGDLSQLPSPRGTRGSIWDGSDYHAHGGQLSPMTPQIPLSMQNFKFPPSPPTPPKRALIHDLMRADL